MATISILVNTVRLYVNRRSDDTAFGAGTISWQDPVHSWKASPGEAMAVGEKIIHVFLYFKPTSIHPSFLYLMYG